MERITQNIEVRMTTDDIALVNALLARDKEKQIVVEERTYTDDDGKTKIYKWYSCPVCNSGVGSNDKFCKVCGQRFDTENYGL